MPRRHLCRGVRGTPSGRYWVPHRLSVPRCAGATCPGAARFMPGDINFELAMDTDVLSLGVSAGGGTLRGTGGSAERETFAHQNPRINANSTISSLSATSGTTRHSSLSATPTNCWLVLRPAREPHSKGFRRGWMSCTIPSNGLIPVVSQHLPTGLGYTNESVCPCHRQPSGG